MRQINISFMHATLIACLFLLQAESATKSTSASHVLRSPFTPPPRISDLLPSTHEYKLDEYFVHADDGYILRLFRLVSLTAVPIHHHPVMLLHGLLDSCAAFLITGPKRALAFVLADKGYEVWLANVRGSSQSRNHSWLNPNDPTSSQYWRFSFDEMAAHDLPALLSKIEDQQTKKSKEGASKGISIISHSQGGTIILAALATQPALADRLSNIILMAPVAFASHIESVVLRALVEIDGDISGLRLYELFGSEEFLPNDEMVKSFESHLCGLKPELCINLLAMIAGVSEIDESLLPKIIAYSPSGTSVQNIIHWTQMIRENRPVFSMMDFGSDCSLSCNDKAYNRPDPPQYNLGLIESKLMILSGSRDKLSTRLDIEMLREALPSGTGTEFIEIESYEHLDFTWGLDASVQVYSHILHQLERNLDTNSAVLRKQRIR